MARLFIIGNGFDLAHRYKTSYKDLKQWIIENIGGEEGFECWEGEIPDIPFQVMGNHGEEYEEQELFVFIMLLLKNCSDINAEWNNFENSLYGLELDKVFNNTTDFIYNSLWDEDGFISDDKKDKLLKYEEQDCEMFAEALEKAVYMIKVVFARWIRSIQIGGNSIKFGREIICNGCNKVDTDDIFISFNYTETLQKVYGVPENQVFHLHGNRNETDNLIVGHGNDLPRNFPERPGLADIYMEEAIRSLRKDTAAVIKSNEVLWKKIKKANIEEIYSFGFSFSEVDIPYIEKICSLVDDNKKHVWYLNYRDRGNKNDGYKKIIMECGFNGDFDEYHSFEGLFEI